MNAIVEVFKNYESRLSELEKQASELKKAILTPESEFVNKTEFREILGITEGSFYVKKCRGELPQTIGGRLLWKRSDVQNWLQTVKRKNGGRK